MAAVCAGLGGLRRRDLLLDGCISTTTRLTCANGSLVLKQRPGAPADLFACEIEGLEALRPSLVVPAVLANGPGWLLLEDCGPQVGCEAQPFAEDDPRWEDYGRAYARLHGRISGSFGWSHDTWWGLMRMDQTPTASGHEFYAERRLRFFLRRPTTARWLDAEDRRRIDRIAERLPDLVPDDPPCLNHGDLWAGNRVTLGDRLGAIDPFIHNGWAEADLHNPLMFGGFPERFFDAYRESRPLAPGWRNRCELWYLLHLLGMLDQTIEVGIALPWLRRLTTRYAG